MILLIKNVSVVVHCSLAKSETCSRSTGEKKIIMLCTETRPVV